MRGRGARLSLAKAGLAVGLLFVSVGAQVSFERTYGGALPDQCYSCAQVFDGGYVLLGNSRSFGTGRDDIWLVRTDSLGETLWTREYGGSEDDYGLSVAQTADGGYIMVGCTESFGAGDEDVYLVRADAHGDTLWTRTFGGDRTDEGYSVQQTFDGGFVVAGRTGSFGSTSEAYLVKTDAAGDTQWTRHYGGIRTARARSIVQTADSGYVIAGTMSESIRTKVDVMIMKTGAAGDSLWARTYGGDSADDYGYSILPAPDGGFFVAGATYSFGAGQADAWLIRTDSLGESLWTRCYGDTSWEEFHALSRTADGGMVAAGFWQDSYGTSHMDAYVLRFDAQGETLWTKTFGDTLRDEAWAVQGTADGGIVVAGITSSFGAGGPDMYCIKTEPDGHVGVTMRGPECELTTGRFVGSPSLFTSATTLRYALAVAGPTRLRVRDIAGRVVRTLSDASRRPGIHTVLWDGRDAGGEAVPGGVYVATLETSSVRSSCKLIVLR